MLTVRLMVSGLFDGVFVVGVDGSAAEHPVIGAVLRVPIVI
jgi:hypothetical protein